MIGCHDRHQRRKKQKSGCNKNLSQKSIQRRPICLIDSDHYFILEKSNVETQLNTIEELWLTIGANK